jgi:hypothetical protein
LGISAMVSFLPPPDSSLFEPGFGLHPITNARKAERIRRRFMGEEEFGALRI